MRGTGEGDAKETRGESLDVGVSDGAQTALEDGSVEDEDTEKPEEAINAPNSERWPDVILIGSAEGAVRMASSGSKRGSIGLTRMSSCGSGPQVERS